jgi:hypothetical protein
MPGGWAGAELTKDATCNPGCSQGLTTFAKVEGCCVGSIHEAKRMWWDAVVGIPSGDDDATAGSVSVDSDMFSCYARQGGTSCGAIPGGSQVMTLSRPSGSCASRQNGVTMNCYLSECRASMPAACCAGIECTNGGTRAYAGQCFCDCKPGFYGVDCALQVLITLTTIRMLIVARFMQATGIREKRMCLIHEWMNASINTVAREFIFVNLIAIGGSVTSPRNTRLNPKS